jgi:hypothetical protein
MSTPEQPAAPSPAAPPAPHENLFERVEGKIFPHGEPAALQALTGEARTALRGHSAQLIHVAASILAEDWPGGEQAASKVLEIALGVAKVAGIAL